MLDIALALGSRPLICSSLAGVFGLNGDGHSNLSAPTAGTIVSMKEARLSKSAKRVMTSLQPWSSVQVTPLAPASNYEGEYRSLEPYRIFCRLHRRARARSRSVLKHWDGKEAQLLSKLLLPIATAAGEGGPDRGNSVRPMAVDGKVLAAPGNEAVEHADHSLGGGERDYCE